MSRTGSLARRYSAVNRHFNCCDLEFETDVSHCLRESGGDFLPFLLVAKGKKLIARLLPFLKHDSALKILHVVTSNLPALMGRDTEEVVQFFCALLEQFGI